MLGQHLTASVVMPCHNGAKFIEEAVDSVLSQTQADAQCVVVDDASTDASRGLVERLARRAGGRLTAVFLDRNVGACRARNIGAERALGSHLMFVDVDDVLTPDAVATHVASLRRSGAGISIVGWKRLEKKAGAWVRAPSGVDAPPEDPRRALEEWLLETAWAPPCAVMWTRSAFQRVGGWDPRLRLNQDGDVMMRAMAAGERIVRSGQLGALYRTHAASLSNGGLDDAKIASLALVLEKLETLLAAQGRLDLFRGALAVAYHRAALRAYRGGLYEAARRCEHAGAEIGGAKIVSDRLLGRALERLVGLESKERLTQALARAGLKTRARAVHLG